MSESATEREDAFNVAWPVIAFVFGAVCDVLTSAGKFNALFELLLLPVALVGFVTAIVWIAAVTFSAYRRRWKRVLSAFAAAPAGLLAMPGLWSSLDIASEVRLIVNCADYDRQISALSAPAGQRRIAWNWGGNTTAVTGGQLYRLVYDETILLPTALCSGDPGPSADRPWCISDRSEPRAWRLWKHFYLLEKNVG